MMTFTSPNYSPITSEEDISATEDFLLDFTRKIFVHHYGETYKQMDLSLYQTIPHKHPNIPNCTITPHFVRDDGVIIYLQLMQNNMYLKHTSNEIINLSMEILQLSKTSVFTITLKNDFLLNDIYNLTNENILISYDNISENIYTMEQQKPNIIEKQNSGCVSGFYKNEWVSASKTRNFALKDTLIDWLDHWYDKCSNKLDPLSLTSLESSSQGTPPNESNLTLSSESRTGSQGDSDLSLVKSVDNSLSFTKFIMGAGLNFESKVIELIKKNVAENEFVTICNNARNFEASVMEYEKKSIEEILKGTPIIYQPLLMNREGDLSYSYGLPDLLVRSDYLHKIVKLSPLTTTRQTYKAPKLKGNYHYVVVDIKFTTLDLCADGLRIRNSGSIPAYKCQLYVYNHALGKIQGYEPTASYILGRRFKYISKGRKYSGGNCFSRMGHIEYNNWDNSYISTTISAINWIKKLRTKGQEWDLLPKPSLPQLYPNMCNQSDGRWENFKSDYAKKIGEITLLWNCGIKNREIAHKNGVYSYWDPKCNSNTVGIKGPKQAPILDEIISINKKRKFDTAMERIHININNEIDNQWMKTPKLRLSVDFEIISNVFDNFTKLPNAQENDFLFMIGVAYEVKTGQNQIVSDPISSQVSYKMFLISELSQEAEFQLIHQFYCFLRELTNKHLGKGTRIPDLYHWGNIERTYFSKLCLRLEKSFGKDVLADIKLMKSELSWYDLLECFKKNPIVINGCFKFGLKEVAGRLSELGLIRSNWKSDNSSCNGGATAMLMAHNAYQTARKTGIPIIKNPSIREIMEYNKIDCIVLHEIVNFLKQKIDSDASLEPLAKKPRHA